MNKPEELKECAPEEILKRLLIRMNKVTAWYRHQGEVPEKEMIKLCNYQIEAEELLEAWNTRRG